VKSERAIAEVTKQSSVEWIDDGRGRRIYAGRRANPQTTGRAPWVVVCWESGVMTWHRISAVFKDWRGCVETTDFSIAMLTGIAFAFSRIANRCRCAFVRPEQLGFSNAGAPLR
jgi:hypothetical protein